MEHDRALDGCLGDVNSQALVAKSVQSRRQLADTAPDVE
jgi:hypothetical protein